MTPKNTMEYFFNWKLKGLIENISNINKSTFARKRQPAYQGLKL